VSATGAWHPDPYGEASWRWWDGAAWGAEIAPAREAPDLAPLESAIGRSLVLEQQHGTGTDVLRCGTVAVGLMHKSFALDVGAEVATGAWKFDRRGIVSGRAHVLVEPARAEIGAFAWDGGGTDGTLQFADGRWFRLARARQLAQEGVASPADYDPSHAVWVWYGPDRTPFMTVRLAAPAPQTKTIFGREIQYTSSSTGKTGMEIWTDVHQAAAGVRELPLLTVLGSFLIWWITTVREGMRRRRMSRF
jgi:hypothetical protein